MDAVHHAETKVSRSRVNGNVLGCGARGQAIRLPDAHGCREGAEEHGKDKGACCETEFLFEFHEPSRLLKLSLRG